MRVDEFYQSRKADWENLSNLIELSQKNMRGLSESQVRDISRLYRAATSDLALAKRDFPRSEITAYLNQLVARAHAVVYHSEPLALKRLWRFATTGFPRLFPCLCQRCDNGNDDPLGAVHERSDPRHVDRVDRFSRNRF